MPPVHKQVLFYDLQRNPTHVDEDLYDILTLLRDHGVQTRYSCQGSDNRNAYVQASYRTMRPLIRRVKKTLAKGGYSHELTSFIKNFKLGFRQWQISILTEEGQNERIRLKFELGIEYHKGFAIERSWTNCGYGFRTVVRWPADRSDEVVQLLKETPKG